MPPRRGIVKSGNAGNSSKPVALNRPTEPVSDAERPLFPPGSKTPLNLLQERCRANGWEKPIVDTRKQGDGYSFTVTLARFNKKTSSDDKVRMQPHPAYISPSALEARHWGATYALYRFSNNLQLNRVLPPGPQAYWAELAAEHKTAPDHLQWMYAADPFAAHREVEERQRKSAKKREEASAGSSSSGRGNLSAAADELSFTPEVKMPSDLRELTEEAIKKGIAMYPEAGEPSVPGSLLPTAEVPILTKQLGTLGFTAIQIQNAINFLSEPSEFATNLLQSLPPLQACTEYLILHLPECDLPPRFKPSSKSSNPFITSAHSGNSDLKLRWIEDRAVKEGGWPAHAVAQLTATSEYVDRWDLLTYALGQKLIGAPIDHPPPEGGEAFTLDRDEVEGMGAYFADPSELVMPLFSAPIQLHVLVGPNESFPRRGYAPMFITSDSVPPYVRLHLLSQLLEALQTDSLVEPGEGLCMSAMRVLEDGWSSVETNGPPDMKSVLRHMAPTSRLVEEVVEQVETMTGTRIKSKPNRTRKVVQRNSDEIKQAFLRVCQKDKYKELLVKRETLPAFTAKDEFLKMLEGNRVVVVVGETGCGKTTQLPQFILDSLILSGRGADASIVVTQPRRISAISIAGRVSTERGDDGSVAYSIRGESTHTDRTQLLFCTTGVVLRRLGPGDQLNDVSHIIVDEVHERTLDGDFLLLELKNLLVKNPTLKIILMSATINHETFINYFGGAPLLTIPGFTHPINDIYLEDVIPVIRYTAPSQPIPRNETTEASRKFRERYKEKGLDEQSITSLQNLSRSTYLDFQLIAEVVRHIITGKDNKTGGILVFLPGVNEIRHCISAIRNVLASNAQATVLPLHANLTNDEQRRVFVKTSGWKVVVATNVAETSITIDDVIYVVDAGKVKETQFDPTSSLSKLVENWVSRAAARQRRGRAGRTQPGTCYKLYTAEQESNMARFPVPEILRVPLESVSLMVKVMREDEDVKLFLNNAIDPPKLSAMEEAWETLRELGAIDENDKLTPLGRYIASIPVDLRLAKMLVLGTLFQCLDPVLTIAALLSSKPLFLVPMDRRDEANKARAGFLTANSDLLTDAKAYDECIRVQTTKSHLSLRAFCETNFISSSTVRDISTLREDFLSALIGTGIVPESSTTSTTTLNTYSTNTNLTKSILLGSLWPRVARVHLPEDAVKFDKVSAGTVRRENTAREYRFYDTGGSGRVFLHPGSVLFNKSSWKSRFIVYFSKNETTKVFLRDATEVPTYSLLLFGGPVSVDHIKQLIVVGNKAHWVRLKASPRIGVLVNQLRRLLDAHLLRSVESGSLVKNGQGVPVLGAIMALLGYE